MLCAGDAVSVQYALPGLLSGQFRPPDQPYEPLCVVRHTSTISELFFISMLILWPVAGRNVEMKLICVEEHVMDGDIVAQARPALQREAPYMVAQESGEASPTDRRLGDFAAGRIAEMDAHGIDMQILSYSSPVQLVPETRAVALAAAANDRLAQAVSSHPDRFGGFALLPWQVPGAAVDELDRAVTELGLNGVLIVGRPGPGFLDEPRYAPILAKLDALRVPLYVHPYDPIPEVQRSYYAGFAPAVTAQLSLGGWGWHHEAGVHVVRLVLSGAFERYPNLQVISGHWGEMVPNFLQRLDDVMPPAVTGLSATIGDTYRSHVWVTPSGMFYGAQVDFIAATVGLDRVIWSADYPYLPLENTRSFLEGLAIGDDDRHAIAHRNAERVLGLG